MTSTSRHTSADQLNERDREHYEVARSMQGEFSTHQFKRAYRTHYPARNPGSMLPSDYCVNAGNKGNVGYPRFLRKIRTGRYQYVGLTPPEMLPRKAETGNELPPAESRRRRHAPRRFRPDPNASLRLRRDAAEAAIRAYNSDSTVLGQERAAFSVLPRGFKRESIRSQLGHLDRAYSTRSVGRDLDVIADAIRQEWTDWEKVLTRASPFPQVTEPDDLTLLFDYFLHRSTKRRPRSLATKALHFAKPQCFCPVDTFAADLLGKELRAGSWRDTTTLTSGDFARWYGDYLTVVASIAEGNADLVRELLAIDTETARGQEWDRVRGIPKLIDKILWWMGGQAKRGITVRLFE